MLCYQEKIRNEDVLKEMKSDDMKKIAAESKKKMTKMKTETSKRSKDSETEKDAYL